MKKQTYLEMPDGRIMASSSPEYHRELPRLTQAEGLRVYREQCRKDLLKILKPGSTVYCILRHVSSSGMQRRISLVVVTKDKHYPIRTIDYLASVVTGRTLLDSKEGIVCNGCGMDMGFDLVYTLGRCLWPKGTPKPHGSRNGSPDKDGGYALKHSWL